MAERVIITDDLDGSDGAEHVEFVWRGTAYKLDLGAKSIAKIEKALADVLKDDFLLSPPAAPAKKTARKATRAPKAAKAAKAAPAGPSNAAIREWAIGAGHAVSERGRIASAVREAFVAAHA